MALPLVKTCACGSNVWSAPAARLLPRPEEWLVCPECGRDNSRTPSLRYRLRRTVRLVRRRVRCYGFAGAVRLRDFKRLWLLPREFPDAVRPKPRRTTETFGSPYQADVARISYCPAQEHVELYRGVCALCGASLWADLPGQVEAMCQECGPQMVKLS